MFCVGRISDPADPVLVLDWYVEWYYFRNDHRKMPKNRHLISFVQPGRFRYLISGVKTPPYERYVKQQFFCAFDIIIEHLF